MNETYVLDALAGTPVHIARDGRPLCGAEAGEVTHVIGALVCTRCAGISLREEADRIDPPANR